MSPWIVAGLVGGAALLYARSRRKSWTLVAGSPIDWRRLLGEDPAARLAAQAAAARASKGTAHPVAWLIVQNVETGDRSALAVMIDGKGSAPDSLVGRATYQIPITGVAATIAPSAGPLPWKPAEGETIGFTLSNIIAIDEV